MEQQHGLLIVDKPKGLSSAQCSNRFKRLGQKKIGHAGTLDPMAQGVLVVLLGHATKISGYLMAGGEKVYRGTLRLGQVSDTWDAEGKILSESSWDHVSVDRVMDAVNDWIGTNEQPVPPYSAAKHQGQPLYKLSRAGKDVPIKIKSITLSHAEVLRVDLPYVTFRVACSSGTYIRSLAHSLGIRFGCGAVLTELIREYSHPFALDKAYPLDLLLSEPERLPERILPLSAALPDWPVLSVRSEEEVALRNGHPLLWPDDRRVMAESSVFCLPDAKAILVSQDGTPLALVEAIQGTPPAWGILRGLWH